MTDDRGRFRAVFEAAPDAMLLADDEGRFVEANAAACRMLQRPVEELRRLTVAAITADGVPVRKAWRTFLARGEMRGEYQVQRPDRSVVDVEFHATANVVAGQHLSILRDVSARKRAEAERDHANERLREAHDRAHRIALTLQRAMLPAATAVKDLQVATRYLPAADAMAVGGDWYDLIDIDEHLVGVTVGDVMGHGVAAAGIMGQLRSALAAALHADRSPARAISILDRYARSLYDPLVATVFAGLLDVERRTLAYSSAGHLPPLLLGDAAAFLDRATAPPLGATPTFEPRPETTVALDHDATIVLYTDGLVERRGEDIDVGLCRLAGLAKTLAGKDTETFAERLLDELRLDGDGPDDVALVVIKL